MHYDEKWFWGLVARSQAKACASLGISKATWSARHKSHINKVMFTGVVGYAFQGTPLYGGHGLKIACGRAQAARVAQRDVFHAVFDAAGNRTHPQSVPDGEGGMKSNLKRSKGECNCCSISD